MSKKSSKKSDSSKSSKVTSRTPTRHSAQARTKAVKHATAPVAKEQVKAVETPAVKPVETAKVETRVDNTALIATLAGQLRDPIAETAIAAIESLGQTRDAKATQPLTEVLQNNDGYFHVVTRASAAMALGQLGQSNAITALITAANDTSAEVSCEAILALGELKAAEAVDTLVNIVQNFGNYYLNVSRHAAIRSLGLIKAASARSVLEQVAGNPFEDSAIACAARDAISAL